MNILLVKLSSLGDVIHTLPVVQDIRAAFPAAHIDWVVEKSFAPVLAPCPDLGRIIPCEIRRWRKAPLAAPTRAQWRAFKADLQATPYDAVIDLQGLTKSALVARLARLTPRGQRYAMANRTLGSGYEAATRWVADVAIALPPQVHAVQRGRWLCAQALGFALQDEPRYGLRAQAFGQALSGKPCVLLVHGTSRADKEWPLADWVGLGQRLLASGYQIALPHGSDAELVTSQRIASALCQLPGVDAADVTVWPRLPLDQLTGRMAACSGVIGVDSGLSHLAVALDLPHVQLYNFDTAWRTGPAAAVADGTARQCSVYAQPAPLLDAVWQAWLACSAAT